MNFAWASCASAIASESTRAGRNQTPSELRMETSVRASPAQPSSCEAIRVRAYWGSSGNSPIRLPISVRWPSASRAPSRKRMRSDFTRRTRSGGSMKSKVTTLSMPITFIWRTTEARFERRISGTVTFGSPVLKDSSEYRRKHLPCCVRPARPARCVACTCETSVISRDSMPVLGLKTFCLQYPQSMTKPTPATVSEVSAMLVLKTSFLQSSGTSSKTFRWSSDCIMP
mmetsp:Transcript_70771/g.207622  ORF Transcript_70771/g.207622 Transcript_70771/m.207622 type:complete len:228 (-) Transcript_70771:494-1177(-)